MNNDPLLRLVVPLALALMTALAVLGAGSLATAWFGRSDTTSRSFAFRFTVGYPIFGTCCFLVSLITINRLAAWGLLAIFAVISVVAIRHATAPQLRLSVPLLITLAITLAMSLLMAQAPPFTLDEVAYHLAVPRVWVNEGQVVDLPLLTHSYFPFGVESADIPLLAILGADGGVASHFVHLFGAMAVTMLIWDFIARRTRTRSSLAALAAIISTPALLLTAGWSWSDWMLLGQCCALVIALDELELGLPSYAPLASSLAAGLLTKYTFGLFAAVAVAIAIALSTNRAKLSVAALIGGASGSIFFLRNLAARGNPLFPFFSDDVPAVAGYRDAGSFASTMASYFFDPRFVDEALGPALLLCAIAALIVKGDAMTRVARHVSIAAVVIGCALLLAAPSSRILVPFFAVAAMVASAGFEKTDGKRRWLAASFIWLAVFAQLTVAALYAMTLQPWRTIAGDRSSFLADRRRLQQEIVAVDAQLPVVGRTLVVGAQELFWFSKPVRGGGNFDGPLVARYLTSESPEALQAKLMRDRFTHVAVFGSGITVGEASRDIKRRERETVLSLETAQTFQTMLRRHSGLVGQHGNASLFALR